MEGGPGLRADPVGVRYNGRHGRPSGPGQMFRKTLAILPMQLQVGDQFTDRSPVSSPASGRRCGPPIEVPENMRVADVNRAQKFQS